MKIFAFLISVAAAFAPTLATAQTSVISVASLEEKINAGRNVEALLDLYKSPDLPDDVFSWLRAKSEEGLPPLQYELSRRLISTKLDEGVLWYARAYMARSLDFSQCIDRRQNPIYMTIATIYAPVLDKVLIDKPKYGKALEVAVKWESERKLKPSPAWICGDAYVKGEEGVKVRNAKLQETFSDIARLKGTAN